MLLSHEGKGNLAISDKWMDLEGIILSDMSQRNTNTV